MYWNNLTANIFHPYYTLQPYATELPEVDTSASVWTLRRFDSEPLKQQAEAIRMFVERGGSLYVPVTGTTTAEDLNAVFGWNMQVQEAPRATIVPDPNKPEKQHQVVIPPRPSALRDLRYFLPEIMQSPKKPDKDPVAMDVASLPPKAIELYTASVVHAFTTIVGDGRVSYVGYQGHGRPTAATADQDAWKKILVRLMRGQRQLDVSG